MKLQNEVTPAIRPGNDFFHYVNQNWLNENPIPDDKARNGVFENLTDENIEKLRELLDLHSFEQDSEEVTLLRKYYRIAMDGDAVSKATPIFIKNTCDHIANLTTPDHVFEYIAVTQTQGTDTFWNIYTEPDDKDSHHYVLRMSQGGLGLPERDYYLDQNERFELVRTKYKKFLVALLELLGIENAEKNAADIFEIEYKLAVASMSATMRRDPDLTYNPFQADALKTKYPSVPWDNYFQTLGLIPNVKVVISQPDFLQCVAEMVRAEPIESIRNYLLVHSVIPIMTKLAPEYEDLHFDFYGKVLRGSEKLEARYRRVIHNCMAVLPEPTGKLFVEEYFDESAKAEIHDLVLHLKEALRKRIEQLEWMSDTTKSKAVAKLETFLPLLGYPDEWRSYRGLELDDSFPLNFLKLNAFEWERQAARVSQKVNRKEWLMSPVMVNAYYWPNTNGITFPAGILQPPFFDAKGDFASNYGSIGAVIGHEMIHGFDDEGSKFDAEGNLSSWWTEQDRKAFEQRTKGLVEQFNQLKVDGSNVNGELTLGENIADLGGVQVAFDALQAKLSTDGSRDEIDGFSPEQRFFIGYGRTWRGSIRPELSQQYLVSDPHAPAIHRVNGIVRNLDVFYDAFNIQASDSLYIEPDKRVRIW